jgi:hypothetical protein
MAAQNDLNLEINESTQEISIPQGQEVVEEEKEKKNKKQSKKKQSKKKGAKLSKDLSPAHLKDIVKKSESMIFQLLRLMENINAVADIARNGINK